MKPLCTRLIMITSAYAPTCRGTTFTTEPTTTQLAAAFFWNWLTFSVWQRRSRDGPFYLPRSQPKNRDCWALSIWENIPPYPLTRLLWILIMTTFLHSALPRKRNYRDRSARRFIP